MPRRKVVPDAPPLAPQEAVAATPAPIQPAPPSPAVLKLQDKVVELFEQRGEARKRLSALHTACLTAQSAFQAGEADVKAAEQDAQYILGLIAQLENRVPVTGPTNISVMPMPNSLAGVTSEPTGQAQGGGIAMAPLMTRRDIAAMM